MARFDASSFWMIEKSLRGVGKLPDLVRIVLATQYHGCLSVSEASCVASHHIIHVCDIEATLPFLCLRGFVFKTSCYIFFSFSPSMLKLHLKRSHGFVPYNQLALYRYV